MTSLLDKMQQGRSDRPSITIVNGGPGVGKSNFVAYQTIAAGKKPLILDSDNGLSEYKVDSIPFYTSGGNGDPSFEDLIDTLREITKNPNSYNVIALDSADKFEPIIWDSVCKDLGIKTIEQATYGKGYNYAREKWRRLCGALSAMRERGFEIILTCHCAIKNVNQPHLDPYDQWAMRLHKHPAGDLFAWADAVLFAAFETKVKKGQGDFGKITQKAQASGRRILYTGNNPAVEAKNRFGLPDQIEMDYDVYQNLIQESRKLREKQDK